MAPCSCMGSLKYIHVECLQKWMESRKEASQTNNSISLYWKNTGCEICKQPYPFTLKKAGRNYSLLMMEKAVPPYIVFEAPENCSAHVVSVFGSAKLGRGHDSDVRIPDISVSRVHACIHYRDGGFFFEDLQSKFGSLLQAKSSLNVEPGKPLCVQVGRSIFSLNVEG